MTQQTAPFLEGKYGWDFGESGWNTGMDENLLKFSFMFDRNVDSITASLPAAVNGQSHYLTTDNRVYFAVGTTYFSSPVPKWFQLVLRSTGDVYQFNGVSLNQIDSPASLDSRLDTIEVTVNSLGTAAFQNVEFFATQSELDVSEATSAAYTDLLRSDLAATTGSTLVGHGAGTVNSKFDAIDTSITNIENDLLNIATVSLDSFAGATDYDKLVAAFAYAKTNKVAIWLPARTMDVTGTLEYDTTGLGNYQGLRLLGSGQLSTVLVNKIAGGGPTIRLTSGASSTDQQHGGIIQDVGFTESGSGANSHGIEYRGTWHQRFENLNFLGLNGSALRPVNTNADADSSAQVDISTIRAFGCAGPAFDSNGGSGGLTLHTLHNFYSVNCGGSDANFVIDGCIHFRMDQFSAAGASAGIGYTGTHKGIHIKASVITSRNIEIGVGEIGNSLVKGILVNAVQNLTLGKFRFVKRAGETTFTHGIEFIDGALGIHNGVDIQPIGLQIDTATPAFTFLTIGTGINERFSARGAASTAFAVGNTYAAFTSDTAKQRIGYLEDISGRVLFSRGEGTVATTLSVPGAHKIELSAGSFHRLNITVAGAYTITAPDGNQGQAFDLYIANGSGGAVTVTFSGFAVTGYTDPASGQGRSARFVRDVFSAAWRQIGAWSA